MTAQAAPALYFWLGEDGDFELPDRPGRRVLLAEIQARVAEHYQVPLHVMTSLRRDRAVARPRQVAMYLARQFTRLSTPAMGQRFGGRDHTTVLHGIRQIEQLRVVDNELDHDIRQIAQRLSV